MWSKNGATSPQTLNRFDGLAAIDGGLLNADDGGLCWLKARSNMKIVMSK